MRWLTAIDDQDCQAIPVGILTRDGDKGRLAYLRKLKQLGVVYDTPFAEMAKLLEESKLLDIESREVVR